MKRLTLNGIGNASMRWGQTSMQKKVNSRGNYSNYFTFFPARVYCSFPKTNPEPERARKCPNNIFLPARFSISFACLPGRLSPLPLTSLLRLLSCQREQQRHRQAAAKSSSKLGSVAKFIESAEPVSFGRVSLGRIFLSVRLRLRSPISDPANPRHRAPLIAPDQHPAPTPVDNTIF